MWVGNRGEGEFNVTSGEVAAARLWIGRYDGSSGNVSLIGSSSSLVVSEGMVVGDVGDGTLAIRDGASVSAAYMRVGASAGGNGTLAVRNEGSHLNLLSGSLAIGDLGDGTLEVLNGGSVTSVGGQIGWRSSAVGQALVRGNESNWTSSAILNVGYQGQGTLEIEDAGRVTSTRGSVGFAETAIGTVAVTGSGSRWTVTNDIIVGDYGQGLVDISYGGTLESGRATIGMRQGARGEVSVRKAESTWSSTGDIVVGHQGQGKLRMEEGARVNSVNAMIARLAGSNGEVDITGQGTLWQIDNALTLGDGDSSYLAVENGGGVSVGTYLGVSGTGIVDLSRGGSMLVGAGTLPAANTLLIGPGGTLSGTGTILADVQVAGGTVSPGNSPGRLFVDSISLLDNSHLIMEIGGAGIGQYDVLDVAFDAQLGGSLTLNFVDGFTPIAGHVFGLIECGDECLGSFDDVRLMGLDPGWQYSLGFSNGVYNLTSLIDGLPAVPEPARLTLWMGLALAGIAARWSRRRLRGKERG